MADILCTTDLSPASDAALLHALALGDRLGARVTLLHCVKSGKEAEAARAVIASRLERSGATAVKVLLPECDFMEGIAAESGRGHSLLVMGTHGPRGLRQSIFGADILKLARQSAIPCYVVQEGGPPSAELGRMVMPVASHQDIGRLLDAVCLLAKAFTSEVHVYQLLRPGEEPSEQLLDNKALMLARLSHEGIRHVEANEPSTAFSVGFASATIAYAKRIGAGAIAIMAHASDEYRYIADAEKERLLANDARIPVLCA